MRSASILLTFCLGLAAASLVRRQDADPTDVVVTEPATDAGTMSQETMPVMNTTAPPPPAPTKLTEIDEIIFDFDALSTSDFYKRLSYEDQLLALEVLTGSEVGKMTAILNEVGFKHFIRFMYDLPLKYIDQFKGVLDRGFEKEIKLSLSN